jgi:5-hydroxyisourate hydrolase-like protein (transthyretin family)
MSDLTKAKEDAKEALANVKLISKRISYDESKRLEMSIRIISKYIVELEGRIYNKEVTEEDLRTGNYRLS